MMSKFCLGFMTALLMVAGGCSGWVERQAVRGSIRIMERNRTVMQRESDIELARAAAPAGLATMEAFLLADPGNRALQGLLAEAYCQYANGFVGDDWEQARMDERHAEAEAARARARGLLVRCVRYGLMLLGERWQQAMVPALAGIAAPGDLDGLAGGGQDGQGGTGAGDLGRPDPEAALPLVERGGREAVAGMFWVALGLGTMIGMDPGDGRLVAHLPLVEALLERVIALDDDYLDGLPHLTLGIVLSSQSAAVGGDPARGKRHFARARALTRGKSLLVPVMMARTYAVVTRDEALFRSTLLEVLRTPPGTWPAGRLMNELAHRKARRYLTHANRFF